MARAIGSACLISAIVVGWRARESPQTPPPLTARDGVVTWSPAALASLRAQGLPVFVDVTADWCITCLSQ